MKKLYIMNETVSSRNNGIGTYIRELITCISGFNIQITILAFNSDRDFFSIEETAGICYFYFPKIKNSFQENWKLYNNFFRLYIVDSPENIFLINYSPCSLLMKAIKKFHPLSKQIYVIHDMGWTMHLFGDLNAFTKMLNARNGDIIDEKYIHSIESYNEERKMCELADKVVCLSDDTYKLLKHHYRIEAHKVNLIPHGISDPGPEWSAKKKTIYRHKMYLDENEKIVLYVGRIIETKGTFVLIEAFKDILKAYPECRLVIAGSTNISDYLCKCCSSAISKIIFTGLLSHEELERWYQIANIGIIPSYTEQCGYVGIEMMAHGLPVVASDGFGVRSMFQDGENAKVACIGSRRSIKIYKSHLVDALLYLLHSPLTCTKLGKRSKEIFLKDYTLKEVKKKYKQLFECD